VAVNPAGTSVYVANRGSNTISVIETATNTVVATVSVGANPFGVAVTPDGTRVYVAHRSSNNVSVIDTASNTVVATKRVRWALAQPRSASLSGLE
jgi:YVTN family beta-propeller protein